MFKLFKRFNRFAPFNQLRSVQTFWTA